MTLEDALTEKSLWSAITRIDSISYAWRRGLEISLLLIMRFEMACSHGRLEWWLHKSPEIKANVCRLLSYMAETVW